MKMVMDKCVAADKYNDTLTMTQRCIRISMRNPDTMLAGILMPVLMMLLFTALFGKLIRVGDVSYTSYIVPGVMLQCLGQCSAVVAVAVNRDMTEGMMDRLCTLPIRRRSILGGHVAAAVVRNLITSAVVLLSAVMVGFRPAAGAAEWGIVLMILTGFSIVISWLAVFVGLTANSAEGAGALSIIAIILPYLSSGFVPVESMPKALAVFAEYQPLTPVTDALRNTLLGYGFDMECFAAAMIWCVALSMGFAFVSGRQFRRRISAS